MAVSESAIEKDFYMYMLQVKKKLIFYFLCCSNHL